MIDRLDRSARQTASMAERLDSHMRNVEKIRFDIHIKALNTIVMSARLGGHGRSMEVLAQETKFLSDQAHGFVDGVTAIHGAIAGSVQTLGLSETDRGQGRDKGELLADSTRSISETLARFHREAAAAGEQANALHSAIARAGDSLQFLEGLAAELREHHDRLQETAECIAPWVKRIVPAGLEKEDARLQALYSMDRERQMHAAVIGTGVLVPAGDSGPPSPAPADDDGALLFTDGESNGDTGSGKEDDNVELF